MTHGVSLQEMLGFSPQVESSGNASLLRVPVRGSEFSKVLSYWRSLDELQLPALLGVSVEQRPGSKIFFNILLSPKRQSAFVCVEVEFSAKDSLPDLVVIWPHAAWWQEEFCVFSSAAFSGDKHLEEIKWRQA